MERTKSASKSPVPSEGQARNPPILGPDELEEASIKDSFKGVMKLKRVQYRGLNR